MSELERVVVLYDGLKDLEKYNKKYEGRGELVVEDGVLKSVVMKHMEVVFVRAEDGVFDKVKGFNCAVTCDSSIVDEELIRLASIKTRESLS